MDNKSIYIISILTTRNKSEPIHGLLIEAWIRGSLDDDCIGKVYTNRNGIANLTFEPNDSVISRETPVLKIYLRIRDRDGSLIYSTKEEPRALRPDEPLGYHIVLDKEVLAGHFSRPLSWEAPSGHLVPEERKRHIKAAISLIASPEKPDHEALIKASLNIHPPIDFFDNILQDAWLVLQGDPDALLRFRDALGVIYANSASNAQNSFENAVNIDNKIIYEEVFSRDNIFVKQLNNSHLPKDLVPIDNIRILLMAAFHAGGGNKALSTLYLKIVLDQLSKYCLLEALHRASVGALTGGDIEKNHFRGMLFCISGLGFGDGGFMPPVGGGGLGDWDGLGDWNAGRWGTIPNPEGEIGPIIRELEKGGLPTLGPCEMEMLVKLLPFEFYIITEVIPSRACPGEDITIKGNGFGNLAGKVCFRQYGSNDFDVFPIEVAPISWSETEIKVKVPNGAGFFLRLLLQPKIAKICGKFIDIRKIGLFNAQFEGSSPEIHYFFESSNYNSFICPGDPLDIHWGTKAADHVYIEIRDDNNSLIGKLDPAGKEGEWKFIKTNFNSFTRLHIKIVAKGKCNLPEVERTIDVTIQQMPSLNVLGLEVIQTIQRFDLANNSQNNNVRLVANKRTLVRVYVDSGITNNFDSGAGANNYANVTGSLNIWTKKGIVQTITNPLNVGSVITARPSAEIDRKYLDQTLNFELPLQILSGKVEIKPKVWVQSHKDEIGWSTEGTTVKLDFQPRRIQNLVKILVQDNNQGNAAPTNADYNISLQGARTRYPIAENGFIVYTLNQQVITTNQDLTTKNGWSDLLDDIEDIADDFDALDYIWTALVPNVPYNIPDPNSPTGFIQRNGLSVLNKGQGGIRVFVARATLPATFAHEMGHTFGINHGPGCMTNPDEKIDPDLPKDTEDIGMDVSRLRLIPSPTSELMSYCTPTWPQNWPIIATYQDRWPSIAFWDKIFGKLS